MPIPKRMTTVASGRICAPRDRRTRTSPRAGSTYTVIRPGPLTDDPGTGAITIGRGIDTGPIPRDDVAATIAGVLETPATSGLVLDLRGGGLQIAHALDQL